MERDALKSTLVPIILHFNSHAHVERDTWDNLPDTIDEHFNSHAHVERDIPRGQERQLYLISTHTLTWSVTVLENVASIDFTFQLTRSRGA